jgi:hypothetical protein
VEIKAFEDENNNISSFKKRTTKRSSLLAIYIFLNFKKKFKPYIMTCTG